MRATGGPTTPVKESSEQVPREEWSTRLRRGAAEVLESEHLRAITSRFGSHPRDLEHDATIPPEAVAETLEMYEMLLGADPRDLMAADVRGEIEGTS